MNAETGHVGYRMPAQKYMFVGSLNRQFLPHEINNLKGRDGSGVCEQPARVSVLRFKWVLFLTALSEALRPGRIHLPRKRVLSELDGT